MQSHAGETFNLTVYTSDEDGFHNEAGQIINNSAWKIAKGTKVKIVFKFNGEMESSLDEEHEIHMGLLLYENRGKPPRKIIVHKLESVSATNLEAVLLFTAGEFGEKLLKIYCVTDCDGMDLMDKLRIEVI
jgi:hypothetical protein